MKITAANQNHPEQSMAAYTLSMASAGMSSGDLAMSRSIHGTACSGDEFMVKLEAILSGWL